MGLNSKYLVKNRFGVFYFQKRLSIKVIKGSPSLPKLVRLSLHTKSIKEAVKLVRLILVMWDLRAKQYFPDEMTYHKAMALFQEFKKICKLLFQEAQRVFLDSMDDDTASDNYLLDKATDYQESLALERLDLKLLEEIGQLRVLIGQNQVTHKNPATHSVSLDEAFDEFISHSKTSWRANSAMENSFRVSYYPVLRAVIGDVKTADITKVHINQFLRIITNLPANKSKMSKYQDLPLTQFITTPLIHC